MTTTDRRKKAVTAASTRSLAMTRAASAALLIPAGSAPASSFACTIVA